MCTWLFIPLPQGQWTINRCYCGGEKKKSLVTSKIKYQYCLVAHPRLSLTPSSVFLCTVLGCSAFLYKPVSTEPGFLFSKLHKPCRMCTVAPGGFVQIKPWMQLSPSNLHLYRNLAMDPWMTYLVSSVGLLYQIYLLLSFSPVNKWTRIICRKSANKIYQHKKKKRKRK